MGTISKDGSYVFSPNKEERILFFRWDIVFMLLTMALLVVLIVAPFYIYSLKHSEWYWAGYGMVLLATLGFMPGWMNYLNYLDDYYTFKRWEPINKRVIKR